MDPGSYFIEVNDGASHAVLLSCNVAEGDTLVRVPDDTLHPTGTITGSFASVSDTTVSLYVQILGLERVGVSDPTTGVFLIGEIWNSILTR